MKRLLKAMTVAASLTGNMCVFAAPVVTDVVAKQRYPWNGLVDITCKVAGIDETTEWKFTVEAVMPDAGDSRKVSQFWVVKNGVNSTDKKIQANGTYKLLWDAQADLGAVIYSNMVVRVNLKGRKKVQLWEDGPYWATTNIGADESYEYGYYFWWGDTIGYKFENDKWVAADGSSSNFSFTLSNVPIWSKPIASLESEGWITVDNVLVPKHDAAHVQWGGDWRMPTKQELSDLCSKCIWSWMTTNGVNGYCISGKGDYASASIFLPCSGYVDGTSFHDVGSRGYLWSSAPESTLHAWSLYFGSGNYGITHYYRYRGRPVRPVQGFTE